MFVLFRVSKEEKELVSESSGGNGRVIKVLTNNKSGSESESESKSESGEENNKVAKEWSGEWVRE